MPVSKIYVKLECDKRTNCDGIPIELDMKDLTHYHAPHIQEEAENQGWKYEEDVGYICPECQE